LQEQKKSYNHILKATGLFGGVQVIQIIMDLVRGKFIAILLGPAGMGVASLLTSSTLMIANITGLGLNFSAIRDISQATESKDPTRISLIIKSLRRWVLFTGLLGVVVTLILAPVLSKISFGSREYTLAFIWLSSILVLNAYYRGNLAILQGMRKLGDLARTSVIGSVAGLFVSVPLYYIYGIRGIIPAIILAVFIPFIISSYYAGKINKMPVDVSFRDSLVKGRSMVELGMLMMISVFLGALVVFVTNAFIRYRGGLDDVGFYQAGLSISNRIIGLVFVAMASDFFPRLSAISSDNGKVRETVNQQAEVVILLAAPLLIALIVSAPIIIKLLLSPEFHPITVFVRWVALGMLFQAGSYSVGYISFAKGDKWVFFIVEGLGANLMKVMFFIISYNFWGLKGLGISYVIFYVVYFALILIITRKLYQFTLDYSFFMIFAVFMILCSLTFLLTFVYDDFGVYAGGSVLFILSCLFSLREIDRRTGVKMLLMTRFKKVPD
jgi:O-antigen/teichoic acid export membrane protein